MRYKSKLEEIQAFCVNQVSLKDIPDWLTHNAFTTISIAKGGAIEKIAFSVGAINWDAYDNDWIASAGGQNIIVLENGAFKKSFTAIQSENAS